MHSGAGVIAALSALGYHVIDIPVTKKGEWLIDGRVKSPDVALMAVDVVFIAMHGAYGEDGTVQKICERLHIPFTGSNSFPSSLAFNKDLTKRTLRDTSIKLPKHIRITPDQRYSLHEVVSAITMAFGPDYVIKPTASGSSHGVAMATGSEDLASKLDPILREFGECMVEERIFGTEATCAVLEDFRETNLYVLPPVEIVPPSGAGFFNATVKYDGSTAELCPGRFSYEMKEAIAAVAAEVHQTLGLSQYSRTDCIVQGNDVYFLEVNTLPGLTSESLFPKAAAAVGLSYSGLVDHLVRTARVK